MFFFCKCNISSLSNYSHRMQLMEYSAKRPTKGHLRHAPNASTNANLNSRTCHLRIRLKIRLNKECTVNESSAYVYRCPWDALRMCFHPHSNRVEIGLEHQRKSRGVSIYRHIFGGWKMGKVQYWFHIRIYIYVQINISFCIKFDLCKITCHHLAAGYKALPKTLNCSFQCNINLPMHVVDHTSSSSCLFTICAIASDAVNYTTLPKNIAKHRDISFALTS